MACSQKVELVNFNYYEQELKFQNQIERVARTSRLETRASVTYDRAKKEILVSIPCGNDSQSVRGKIEFYRPSESSLDYQLDLRLNATGVQGISSENLRAGLWKVRVSWTVERQEYFIDQAIVIPHRT